ncbi:hypothetical protein EYF80_058718 [Liparis tanakae]|uniref:Uncharacterized protein n=1 Tax=Liparis tanakae TaxID=230148 RepID=A0A4Z2EQL4_9TELE|nr:hypothetical protein EYF80_058718 [Liparis tanakae]
MLLGRDEGPTGGEGEHGCENLQIYKPQTGVSHFLLMEVESVRCSYENRLEKAVELSRPPRRVWEKQILLGDSELLTDNSVSTQRK